MNNYKTRVNQIIKEHNLTGIFSTRFTNNIPRKLRIYSPGSNSILNVEIIGKSMSFGGHTDPKNRKKGYGTLVRALATQAALNIGVEDVQHLGIHVYNRKRLNNGTLAHVKKELPASTRIVRKLGFTQVNNINEFSKYTGKSSNFRPTLLKAVKLF